ncbi:MAG: penicillin-binding transpeptidase domain-containing protein, partial [Clostridia bacterium]|nr:penicillin-binding transpeptidase domain-containing protein [Clostridia bacterium]
VAPHVIGYVNSDGDGVSGIEKAYDSLLKEAGGTITASFAVDALGRTLQGLSAEVNEEKGSGSGVVLTLDKDIQAFTQQAALKYLKSGAAVVMDVKTGDILALSSVPEFSQNDVAAAISAANSPLIDRAFSAYDLGSVFKISLCAEAIESNIPTSMTVDCTGKIDVSGRIFRCEKLSGHGVEDMEQGLSNSCNIYFITLGRLLGGDKILDMAKRLGFGSTLELAPGLKPSAGVLPTAQQMKIPAALANFSLGQGNFMATPIQVARMISAVANDGLLPQARLVKGIVGADGKMTAIYAGTEPQSVFSSAISGELQQFLINTVDVGTGMPAKPDIGGAGGKTGTAQTGWVKNGKAIDEAWFAGFYPAQNPRYAIIVVSEAGKAGGTSAGPVFKQIADHLAPYCGLR